MFDVDNATVHVKHFLLPLLVGHIFYDITHTSFVYSSFALAFHEQTLMDNLSCYLFLKSRTFQLAALYNSISKV